MIKGLAGWIIAVIVTGVIVVIVLPIAVVVACCCCFSAASRRTAGVTGATILSNKQQHGQPMYFQNPQHYPPESADPPLQMVEMTHYRK